MLVPLFFAQGAQALVINNGTFDNISFWTGTYQIKSAGGGFPSIDTQPYYFGGQTGSNAITQTYTLTSSDLTNLANTGLDFIMSADLFGFSFQTDFSTFTADFLDSVLNSLGSAMLSSVDGDPGAWPSGHNAGTLPSFQQITGSVPFDTAFIEFTVFSQRFGGLDNDGYLDNASFEFTSGTLTPAPEPSTLALFATGLALLAFLG